MTTLELTPELVQSLRESTREILETMVFVTPLAIEEQQVTGSTFADEVVGLLSFTGTRCGMLCIRTTEAVARTIAAKMLMMEPGELSDFIDAVDGFGEVVNMVTGSFKNTWLALGNRMDLSVPTVIHKGYVSLGSSSSTTQRTWLRVQLPYGELSVGVVFEAQ